LSAWTVIRPTSACSIARRSAGEREGQFLLSSAAAASGAFRLFWVRQRGADQLVHGRGILQQRADLALDDTFQIQQRVPDTRLGALSPDPV
jgi:hypothetical protein